MDAPVDCVVILNYSRIIGNSIRVAKKIVTWLCFLMITFSTPVISSSKQGNSMTQTPSIINPMTYSDMAQTSYIPVTGAVSEKELWLSSSTQLQTYQPPLWLAIRGKILLVGYPKEIVALNSEDGNLLWKVPIYREFTFMCNEEEVLIDRFTKWRTYDSSEKIERHISTAPNCFVTAYHQSEKWLWYAFYTTIRPNIRGKNHDYKSVFNRHVSGQNSYNWSYRVPGSGLGSLYSTTTKIFYIVMPDQVHSFSPETGTDSTVQIFHSPTIVSFALTHEGKLLLVVKEEGSSFLRQLSQNGNTEWSVPLNRIAQTMQPPASSPQGTIYFGEQHGLLAVENGKEKWRLELTAGALPIYTTVLKDNSLLVSSVNMLHTINSDGEKTASVLMPFMATCRPIMDTNGHVYVAGSEGIRCLK